MSVKTMTAAVAPTAARPDMARLKVLNREVVDLEAAGRWDYTAFLRILEEVKKAANGQGEAANFLFRHALPDWRMKHWGFA